MIPVRLVEKPRILSVFVGELKVGRLKAWSERAVEAWVDDKSMPAGERYLWTEPTARRAMQAVLQAAGYGKAKGFKVTRREFR